MNPPLPLREVHDLTVDLANSSLSSTSVSSRRGPFGQHLSLPVDSTSTENKFVNPRVEWNRDKHMLKVLSESSILQLLSYFDTYVIHHGVDPLYLHMMPDILKAIYFGSVPPIDDLTNANVRIQLLKWVKKADLQEVKTLYRREINMVSKSSNIWEFSEDLYAKYKSDFMLFWVKQQRHLHHLPPTEFFSIRKTVLLKVLFLSSFRIALRPWLS